MIDSKYLKLVITLHKNGTLKKASQELNLTQSALSHQLKKLEGYLGTAMFHRKANRLYLTEAGREIYEKGVMILEKFNSLELRIQEIKENQLDRYIHGYSETEAKRLADQANSIEDFLHFDTIWEKDSKILEVGCGVGAQTEIIARKNKDSIFHAVDISKESISKAEKRINELEITNVEFQVKDVYRLKVSRGNQYDHAFICFVLEHVSDPKKLLKHIKSLIKPGGTITVIEGDHGSTFFHPENRYARKVIDAQVKLQSKKGGNACIGRQIYPLLKEAGFSKIEVSPRQIYVDNSKQELVRGFTKNTFTAMIDGISEHAISEGLVSKSEFELGIKGLLRTTEEDGIFSYTFFKGVGIKMETPKEH